MKFYTKKAAIVFVFMIMANIAYFCAVTQSVNHTNSSNVHLFTDPNDFDLAYQVNGMISAIGYDNIGNQVQGWVYARDIEDPEPSNPISATIRQKVKNMLYEYTNKSINLYSDDGTTIIGTFTLN